eukprot:TRINITY_DN908_c0_g1_i2.p1 TRINITY_DN908_c0_g1~~TRINITY_DN908_c0_g1_i2.p1  ORF type:complete len:485 (-),score=90.15 TRINITY_DN908_c0_g1_i2:822-2276(-)
MWLVILLLTAIALVLWYFYDDRHDKSVYHCQPRFPLIGNLPTMWYLMYFTSGMENVQFALERALKHRTHYLSIPILGMRLNINDAESLQHILKDKFENYDIPKSRNYFVGELFGTGIFLVNGIQWKNQRRFAKPIFNNISRAQMIPIYIRHANILMKILNKKEYIKGHESVDIHLLFKRLTLDTIGEIGFGSNIGSLEEPVEFSQQFDWVQEEVMCRFLYPLRNILTRKRWKQSIRSMDKFVLSIIEKRRHEPDLENKNDLLSRMLAAVDSDGKKIDDKYIRDVLMNFFIAGRDTTALLLTWTFYMFSLHPDVEAKARKEVMDVIGEDESPNFENIKKLSYLQNVLDETLRLYPPAVPINGKQAVKDDVLPTGVKVQAGQEVVYNLYAYHRLPEYWGEDANDFRPSRWEDPGLIKHPYQFLPFQRGPRICMGMDMAYEEAKTVIVLLFQNGFKFKLVPGQVVTPVPAITFTPHNGLKMEVSKIK